MARMALITDGTVYRPPESIGQHGIRVIPQRLIWSERRFWTAGQYSHLPSTPV
jgi:fatty acid-binding protein DegV